ncbi:MAG TPA: hypothetical protein VF573_25145 [Paraburkholderia sp.]|uniref:hypothetical protein n=1 Tax=Paraburkholderia sp. TaxID=1926495 RepID=UPI002ED2A709
MKVADFACLACYEINLSKKASRRCSHLLQIAIDGKARRRGPSRDACSRLSSLLGIKELRGPKQTSGMAELTDAASTGIASVMFDYKLVSMPTAARNAQ